MEICFEMRKQEAQLSPSDRAMRLVSSNLANYHATVQKLLIRQETRVPGLSCGLVCVILRLAVLVELRLVTDGQTDGHWASTADA